ncbi:hypothetical protein QF037_000345 [Streptomyces canus]|uniref:hypothetical protein n=1 Tax=Streptomyces canus TaxID=58343 RepID=UPI0027833E64|nr:hypothetical protein [Streptomyces canus]MDQ0596000.1 hypothetical protein [Streptomyces canus]
MFRIRRLAALSAGALVLGSGALIPSVAIAAPTSVTPAAKAQAGNSQAQAPTKVTPMAVAPSCVTFTQYPHSDILGPYTNVYVDNRCSTAQRVKVIMRNGYDSGCLQLAAGELDRKFRSNSNNSLQPYVDRLESC